ncbi:MAG: hypothetical protein IPJ74_03715 [Saprospiraceae bacterium]|nr:hypothetical protein [Saprospiraceae bacterium]
MNRRHPIDNAFNKKLEHYDSGAPQYLWESIERQRNATFRIQQQSRQRRLIAALLLIGILAGVMSWYTDINAPATLSSFPVIAEENTEKALAQSAIPNNIFPNPIPSFLEANSFPKENIQQKPNQPKIKVSPIETIATPVESQTEAFEEVFAAENVIPSAAMQVSALQLATLPLAFRKVHTAQSLQMPASGCASFTNGKTNFYFDILAAPGFAVRSLNPKEGDFAKYADTREQTELPRYTYSAALRLSMVTKPGIAVRTGVNYSEINERFEHTIENEVRTIITNIYGQNGEIIGTDTTIETNSRQVVANNRYRTLDIPLLLGYEVSSKNLTLTLNGGAYVNVMFKPNGEFISPEDNRPISFSNDNNAEAYPAFRENLGIGWYGSLGVQYRISPRMQLLVEPHVKAYPRSFTREDFMIDQKYLTAGVFVGIRHQFQL